MSLGRGGMFGDPRTEQEKEMERRLLGGLLQPDTQQAVDGYAQMGGLLGQPEEKPKGYFNGGDFRARDGLSLLLASVADGMARNSGYDATAGDTLFAGRNRATEMARKKAEEQAALARLQALGAKFNMTPEQVEAQALGLRLPEPEKRKGLRPVAGPTGVFVWDADNEQFASPRGGAPAMAGMDEWEDISEEEAARLKGGPGGNRPGGFRPR